MSKTFLNSKKIHQVEVIEKFLAKLAPLYVLFMGKMIFPTQLIHLHQIRLQYFSFHICHFNTFIIITIIIIIPILICTPSTFCSPEMWKLCGENHVFLHSVVLNFLSLYFSNIFVNIWKSLLVFKGLYLDKDLIVHSLYVHPEGRKAGISMPFEYSEYLYCFGTFSETCHTPAYSHLYK